jgi:PAS domain-containing protein
MKRTTLRLPADIHTQLRITAAEEKTTAEQILVDALRNELARRRGGQRRKLDLETMNAGLAEVFLQSMPTFALIKDSQARILWVNFFFEHALQAPLLRIVGQTITQAGLIEGFQKTTIEENIRAAFKSKVPTMNIEGMTLKGIGKVMLRAHRFRFEDRWLGDISFDEHEIKERSIATEPNVLDRLQRIPEPTGADLFVPFLERAPVAMAIKTPMNGDSRIIWANDAYARLSKQSPAKVIGRTTREVFALSPHHPVLRNEAEVVQSRLARMSCEELTRGKPRWSLRFPILTSDGHIALLGVVSPDLQQNATPR